MTIVGVLIILELLALAYGLLVGWSERSKLPSTS